MPWSAWPSFTACSARARLQLISAAFESLIGFRANGPWVKVIDMLAIRHTVRVGGPTVFILNLLPTSLGSYIADRAMMSARTGSEGSDVDTWLQSWTIFYWPGS